MDLAPGARLGPYEIVEPIAAGGMGEVYRARDTRLDRSVAIKVLPAAFSIDPHLRERFEREARAISSLNHPNICTLHDVGHGNGVDFLVLEFLDGQTLADRIARGPLPPADALRIALEVATALAAAHRIGVVHRDLKPANIMLTKAGAKLLDFGLAKPAAPVVAVSGLSMMPTTPPGITAQGTILGTFQYMAPEQIEGLEADARSDVFAFGAVLFEMLTGRTAFEGKTRASLLGAILKDEPPRVSSLQPLSPPVIDRIVSTCLAKDPDDRYQTALDLRRDLRSAAAEEATAAGPPMPSGSRFTAFGWLTLAAVTTAMLALGYGAGRLMNSAAAPAETIQFNITPPPNETLSAPPGGGTGLTPQVALSPDGRLLVFGAHGSNGFELWLRSMATLDAHPIPGTINGAFPFWSPDSRYIAFFANGKLMKVSAAGGPPLALCDAPSGRGGTWNRDNVILFSPSTGAALQRVAASGGVPQPASVLDASYGDTAHRFPSFLPDGRHFLFSAIVGTCCPSAKTGRIRVGTLDSTDATTLTTADSNALFASDHVLFHREGTLMAAPFDSRALKFSGDPFPFAAQVGSEGSRYGSFSASATGTIVYTNGATRAVGRLTWMDRAGRSLGTIGDPASYLSLALSPDERRVAVAMSATDIRAIWIMDIGTGAAARFTFGPAATYAPVWTNDGRQIVYEGISAGNVGLFIKASDGSTSEQPIAVDPGSSVAFTPTDWSRDGRYLLFTRTAAGTSSDIFALPLSGERKPFPLIQTAAGETNGTLSPNGRWLAYQSTESGQSQIYVQPFPPTGGKFQVSRDGGFLPMWRPDGNELFFVSQDGRMTSVAVNGEGSLIASTPTPLFALTTLIAQGSIGRQYAITKDGRFLVNVFERQAGSSPITVVVNWPGSIQK